MKRISGTILTVGFAFLLSCENKNTQDFPVIPYVEFRDLKFTPGSTVPDTLKLSFYLRDGDFDLGLYNTNTLPPFNSIFVLNKITGQLIPVNEVPADRSNLVLFPDKKTIDTLPPLSCSRWQYRPFDTVYYQPNRSYNNISINLYYQDSTQVWKYLDINSYFKFNNLSTCSSEYAFDGRFPQLPFQKVGPFTYQSISSREGLLTYSMTTYFKLLFNKKKLKLIFAIQDRALNRSNSAETSEIQL
jgi:hypothetical protein